MVHAVLVDDRAGGRGRVYDLGSLRTYVRDPASPVNRAHVSNLLRRNVELVRLHQLVLVNIDGQPCVWDSVKALLGDWGRRDD